MSELYILMEVGNVDSQQETTILGAYRDRDLAEAKYKEYQLELEHKSPHRMGIDGTVIHHHEDGRESYDVQLHKLERIDDAK